MGLGFGVGAGVWAWAGVWVKGLGLGLGLGSGLGLGLGVELLSVLRELRRKENVQPHPREGDSGTEYPPLGTATGLES